MGDMSEMRGLVVVFGFIGAIFVLFSVFPPEFVTNGNVTAQSYQTGESLPDLMAWNATQNVTMTDVDMANTRFAQHFITVAGWTLQVSSVSETTPTIFGFLTARYIRVETYENWLLDYRTSFESFDWLIQGTKSSIDNVGINILNLDRDYLLYQNASLTYDLQNSKTKMKVQVVWNEALYSKPSDAYMDDALTLVFNVNYEDRNTATNAFGFVNTLINPFQSIPNIPLEINLLIKAPIWAAMGYILFIVILRIIGSVFGGGGA